MQCVCFANNIKNIRIPGAPKCFKIRTPNYFSFKQPRLHPVVNSYKRKSSNLQYLIILKEFIKNYIDLAKGHNLVYLQLIWSSYLKYTLAFYDKYLRCKSFAQPHLLRECRSDLVQRGNLSLQQNYCCFLKEKMENQPPLPSK